jgi:uncharacterized membrane protein
VTELRKLFRRRLIAGLIVIAPLGVTVWVLWWMFALVDGILGDFLQTVLGVRIPGLGLVLLVLILVGVGWLAEETVGARILEWWHGALDRVPLVSRLYGATRRIVGSVFGGKEQRFFREVVFFEYPTRGQWTLGFVTGGVPPALEDRVDGGVTVFLPTSPNPVTGFLIIVPEDRIVRLPITVEEGFTFILSAGAVPPAARPPAKPGPMSSPATSGPMSSPPPTPGPESPTPTSEP